MEWHAVGPPTYSHSIFLLEMAVRECGESLLLSMPKQHIK